MDPFWVCAILADVFATEEENQEKINRLEDRIKELEDEDDEFCLKDDESY